MIVGVGIDIIEVERVASKIAKGNGFREFVFSADEIAYCESMASKAEHYASRFAAKEAFLKAAALGLARSYELREIEILNDPGGKPSLVLKGDFLRIASANRWTHIHVSMSHLKTVATAVVLIEG